MQLTESDQRKPAEWFDQQCFLVETSAVLGSTYDDEDGSESQLIEE